MPALGMKCLIQLHKLPFGTHSLSHILLTTGVQHRLPLGQAGGRGREGCGESARGGAGMGGSTPSPASKVANTKG